MVKQTPMIYLQHSDAWSRPDIPLHARSMLKTPREGIIPDKDFEIGPLQQINELRKKEIL